MNPASEQPPLGNLQLPPHPLPQPHRYSFSCDRHPTEQFHGFCSSCLCERLTTFHPSSIAPSSSYPGAAVNAIFRRTKSFSASKNEGSSAGALEPQRKSCDVRVRIRSPIEADSAQTLRSVNGPALGHGDNVDGEIRVSNERNLPNFARESVREMADAEVRTMKHHIDLDIQEKKTPGGVFWSAASVFSRKWNKWRRKQKEKKKNATVGVPATFSPEKPISQHCREVQSEITDYGFGRRSCDTEPRFSIDIGRVSVDNPQCSIDKPRASWDGHLIAAGRQNIPGFFPSLVEYPSAVHIPRSDHRVPVKEPIPGDSVQTQQYYLDSSSRRKKKVDQLTAVKKTYAMVGELDEMKMASNMKLTPEAFDYHHRDSNSNPNSWRDECSETFELGIRDNGSIIKNREQNCSKRPGRWAKRWSIWGLIRGRDGRNKHDEDDRYSGGNGFPGSSSVGGRGNSNMFRRASSVSSANSYDMGGLFGSVVNQGLEARGHGKKKRDDLVSDRNQIVDNGMLRFYLAPSRSGNRAGGWRNSRNENSHSITRSVYHY